MAHVTFVHGIANKPPEADLLRIWREALANGVEPLPLGDYGVTSSAVYWADLLYEKPDEDISAHEGVLENRVEAVDASGGAQPPVPDNAKEAAFLAQLRSHLTVLSDAEMATAPPVPPNPQAALERVPLPWFLKKPIMDALLRDVHHYLFDVEFAPPGREAVHIQKTIRKRFVDKLGVREITEPHVVISHSMGTVIAYDCLKRVADCPGVDGLITLGSPLGLDEIQDRLQPGWTRAGGYPSERVAGRWVNLFDRLDPVCGFDPILGNDYCRSGDCAIEDIAVQNPGAWRHSMTKYLRQSELGRVLREMLQV